MFKDDSSVRDRSRVPTLGVVRVDGDAQATQPCRDLACREPGCLGQTFPGATPAELVAAHAQGLNIVAARGVEVSSASCAEAIPVYRVMAAEGANRTPVNLIRTVRDSLWRPMLRRWVNTGPIEDHPDIDEKLRFLAGVPSR